MLIGILALAGLAVNAFGAYAVGGWPAALSVFGGFGAGWLARIGAAMMERDL